MAPSRQEGLSLTSYTVAASLAVGLAVFAIACCSSSGTPDSVADGATQRRLFDPRSVWNGPLSGDVAADPNSTRMVRALAREVNGELAAGTGPFVQTDSYSTPLYVVGARKRGVRVALDDPHASWRKGLQRAFRKVPIPARARPAAGSDGHMTVWQPSRDRLWEFWRARKQAGGWHASWGGAMKQVSKSPGYYSKKSWPHLSERYWGATATSLPVIAGTMLIKELRAGRIRHALAIALPAPRARWFAWPAQRTDGSGPADAIPEGARLRLDPDLDLSNLHLPRMTLMMARAAQRYGIIVRDQTHAAIGFYAQDPVQARKDPYLGPKGFFGGRSPTHLLAKFPWAKLEVVRMRLCSDQSRPCTRG